jgi:hypothetical protein
MGRTYRKKVFKNGSSGRKPFAQFQEYLLLS